MSEPTHNESAEEYFFLREEGEFDFVIESENEDRFHLANKTFYTTCHKISRQNNPNFRKKPPYTFLENWLIHSMFSKSQQILLRFPVIHPKVMMTEGDFIYTPHQIVDSSQEQDSPENYYHEDEEEDYYDDDTFIIGDEGVIVMSAPAPAEYIVEEENTSTPLVMDENTWMGHSKYNGNGLTLHVVNPDIDEKDRKKKTAFHSELSIVKEEDEEEEDDDDREEAEEEEEKEEEESKFISMSPEILNWYRSADLKSMKSIISDSSSSEVKTNDDSEKKLSRQSSESYQSLADMMEEEGNHPIYSQQITTTSYGTLLPHEQTKIIPPIMRVSSNFAEATWSAIDIAQSYHENEESSMLSCLFRIWKVFIFGAGSMLDWRSHIKLQTIV